MIAWQDMTEEERRRYGATLLTKLAAIPPRWTGEETAQEKYLARSRLTQARAKLKRQITRPRYALARHYPHADQFGRTSGGALWFNPKGDYMQTLIEIMGGTP
jgi:hypothetical protein